MKKLFIAILLALFPVLVAADSSSLSFAPPPGDFSVIFLGNLFGVVDGVLNGTGSQIMGAMFAVFNAAMLTLGGIIILYTLMVATMNTAHEGQMLGQKWSSIWIPIRSTLGLALLLPKASGYCTMQIFIMWLTVQGVGAADKVWDAALSYLNRGGVIIQAQATNPTEALTNSTTSGISQGASVILSGQVCMLGLQKQLEAQRQYFLDQGEKGPCSGGTVKELCDTPVPDFLGSVNAIVTQTLSQNSCNGSPDPNCKNPTSWTIPLPNFDPVDYPVFSSLNGACGKITWNQIPELTEPVAPTGSNNTVGGIELSSSEYQSAQMSRAIAIQEMYIDLAQVAQTIVTNAAKIGNNNSTNNNPFSPIANYQFGVPYTSNNTTCNHYNENCSSWGLAPASTSGGMLFNGTEFQGAISVYNAVMMPTINLIAQGDNAEANTEARAFIDKATSEGWIMAGAYFFDLVKLNGSSVSRSNTTDQNTGLENSTFIATTVGEACSPDTNLTILCSWFPNAESKLKEVQSLNDGVTLGTTPVPDPNAKTGDNTARSLTNSGDIRSATVFGFINNSLMVVLPGQPGATQTLQFSKNLTFSLDTFSYKVPKMDIDCEGDKFLGVKICYGKRIGQMLYNVLFYQYINHLLFYTKIAIEGMVAALLYLPLQGMALIFKNGMNILTQPGINPIVALANMGVNYINFAGQLWIIMLTTAIAGAMIPWFGIVIFAILALGMPLMFAWLGIMVSIGFVTAYYIPLLPYMMFTFGSIAWLICVIEAMVAGPIVALGITHPEGHEAFGKGEHAIMIMLNVFLRPAMMIIGYITAIALSYVGVWILNAGFDRAVSYYQTGETSWELFESTGGGYGETHGSGSGPTVYDSWAGIYAFFFSILSYTSIYLIIVQQAFSLISVLPDKILRWIGGAPEQLGTEASRWGEELKGGVKEGGTATGQAAGQIGKMLSGHGMNAAQAAKSQMSGGGGEATAEGDSGDSGGGGGGPPGGASGGAAGGAAGGAGGGAAGGAAAGAAGGPPGAAAGAAAGAAGSSGGASPPTPGPKKK